MGQASLGLRPAREGDRELLFGWANDPTARRMSFSGSPIAWEGHVRWFDAKLRDPECMLYIVTGADGEPVGQVRLDVGAARGAVVSIFIVAEHRARGWGAAAVRLAVDEARRSRRIASIHAYIKPENAASNRAFSRAGFDPPVRVAHAGQAALRMSLELGSARSTAASE